MNLHKLGGLPQSPPKGAGKLVPRESCRKVSKIFLTLFDVFFFTFFALREKCRKVSKIFLTLFDVFDVAPFSWPLLRSTGCRGFHTISPLNISLRFLRTSAAVVKNLHPDTGDNFVSLEEVRLSDFPRAS